MANHNETQRWRLRLHLMPPQGWLNDPNGLCYFKGFYHVFFQYSPDYPESAKRCWGHYVSRDLLHWDFAGVPLAPDESFDQTGVYSGSAVIHEGAMHLFYTGNVKHNGNHDYIHSGREANTVHVRSEDGFRMGDKEVVLQNRDYPHTCTCHVRDPKVWEENGTFFMVLGARLTPDQGAVLLYSCQDPNRWHLEKIMTTKEPFGYMWECPDLFTVDGVRVLSCSVQGLTREAYRHQNMHTAGYFRPSAAAPKLLDPNYREWDFGFDFYAPQTFCAPDGRRILIGWMGLPDAEQEYDNPTMAEGWMHALTLLRELKADASGMIRQYPIAEYTALRRKKWELPSGATLVFPMPFDMEAQLLDDEFRIELEQELILSFSKQDGLFTMQFLSDLGGGRGKRCARIPSVHHLRMIVDRSAIEVYLNEGEVVMTTRFYPTSDPISVSVYGLNASLYPMQELEVKLHDEKTDWDRGSAH